MKDPLIRVGSLRKTIRGRAILDIDEWSVGPGEIVGLLGPNGAGKTTTLKILMGLMQRDSGVVSVLGADPRENVSIRRQVAFLPEDRIAYARMRGREFLDFYRRAVGLWNDMLCNEVLTAWGVDSEQMIGKLSKGQRSKLMLAAVIAREPRLLILDEATSDLDPESVEEVLRLLTTWVADGERAAVIATHRLDEVDRICNTVSVLYEGRMLLNGDLDDIRSEWRAVRCVGEEAASRLQSFQGDERLVHITTVGSGAIGVFREGGDQVAASIAAQVHTGDAISEPVDLRTAYLAVTELQEGAP